MNNNVTEEAWNNAQKHERRYHTLPFEIGYAEYFNAYKQYFQHLDISFDLKDKSIIEIGCADYPALGYCINYSDSYAIEPMPSSHLKTICADKKITIITELAEDYNYPRVDEIWLMNVLQHVKNPDAIINKCKESAKIIRFFEPVNMGTDKCHLHAFSIDYFKQHFGDSVKHYPFNRDVVGFHNHECVYGVWSEKI